MERCKDCRHVELVDTWHMELKSPSPSEIFAFISKVRDGHQITLLIVPHMQKLEDSVTNP